MTKRFTVHAATLEDDEWFAGLGGAGDGEPVELDLTSLEVDSAKRVDPVKLLLLSNYVQQLGQSAPMHIQMPDEDVARLAVMRSGLLFSALQNCDRFPETGFTLRGVSDDASAAWRDLWTQSWSPREPAAGRLFDDEPRILDGRPRKGEVNVLKNPNNAKRATRVVVDPHTRSREFLNSQASQGLAKRWLRVVTPTSADKALRDRRELWMGVVSERIVREPLLNLKDHALKRPSGSDHLSNIRSLALLARTDGGSDSYPRLHILVSDSGYGVVATQRPRLCASDDEIDRQLAADDAEGILRYVLSRPAITANDPGLPWARTGMQVATGQAIGPDGGSTDRDVAAEMTLITGDDRRHRSIWVTAHRNGGYSSGAVEGVPFIGTTFFASLPMPRSEPQTSQSEPVGSSTAVPA